MLASSVNEDIKKKANLRVLQRLDKSIQDILCSATHVVLYEFSEMNQAWEKKNIEGSLFIVVTSKVEPKYKVLILNRNSTDNLEVPVVREFQMQVKEPYLIFRDSSSLIRGLWFHDGAERTFVSQCLNVVVQRLKDSDDVGVVDVTSGSSEQEQDVASALSSLCINKDASENNTTTALSPSEVVLDKKNLQLTLMSLIQDDRFLDLIHAQYIKVSNARNNGGKNEKQTK